MLLNQDMSPPVIALYYVGCVSAPVVVPLLGACMVVAKDWRRIFWLKVFLSVFCLVFLVFFSLETSHSSILSRHARTLRKQTGDDRYYTEQEKLESLVTFLECYLLSSY